MGCQQAARPGPSLDGYVGGWDSIINLPPAIEET